MTHNESPRTPDSGLTVPESGGLTVSAGLPLRGRDRVIPNVILLGAGGRARVADHPLSNPRAQERRLVGVHTRRTREIAVPPVFARPR
jgi:hypothetical protein